jgi:hypothetical protein
MPKESFSIKEARQIGELLGIDWNKFDVEQFRHGMDIELEHGTANPQSNITDDDPIKTGKIVLAHLSEYSDYYARLDKLEKEADEYWGKGV